MRTLCAQNETVGVEGSVTDTCWFSGCQQASLSSAVGTFAGELAREETAHVALLYKALQSAGTNPVAPQIDLCKCLS